MGNRYLDWLRQAEADLQHARHALADGDFEWSCFAAQQAAEKALKAVFQKLGMDAWGHTLTGLIGNLPPSVHRCRTGWLTTPRCWTSITSPHAIPTALNPARLPISIPRKKLKMPFDTQKRSSSSVIIKSIDHGVITRAVETYVARLRAEHPEVKRVIWFGSWVNGLPTPGSDVDLCLILGNADKPLRERRPDYLPVGFPVGIDLFPYTQAEFERLRDESPGWYAAILSGREM